MGVVPPCQNDILIGMKKRKKKIANKMTYVNYFFWISISFLCFSETIVDAKIYSSIQNKALSLCHRSETNQNKIIHKKCLANDSIRRLKLEYRQRIKHSFFVFLIN